MPLALFPKTRGQVVETAHRLHRNGWVANHEGNVSVRLRGNRFLITCTAVSKADVTDAMLLVVDEAGEVLEGRARPFSELDLHLAAYRGRPDADAVLHAHPPYASAWGLVGAELAPIAMPEVVVSLGDRIPTIPRSMPKEAEGARAVEECARSYDAFLLGGNGVITLGTDLSQALLRMELVEHYAKILTLARQVGSVPGLADSEISRLLDARKKAGLGPRK